MRNFITKVKKNRRKKRQNIKLKISKKNVYKVGKTKRMTGKTQN